MLAVITRWASGVVRVGMVETHNVQAALASVSFNPQHIFRIDQEAILLRFLLRFAQWQQLLRPSAVMAQISKRGQFPNFLCPIHFHTEHGSAAFIGIFSRPMRSDGINVILCQPQSHKRLSIG